MDLLPTSYVSPRLLTSGSPSKCALPLKGLATLGWRSTNSFARRIRSV